MKKFKRIIAAVAAAILFSVISCNGQGRSENKTYNLQRAYEVLQKDHDEEQALRLLKEQIKSTPDNAEAFLLRARVFRSREEYGSALSDLNQALKVNKPKASGIANSTLHWWKATIYSQMEDEVNAAESYRTALSLARKDDKENVQSISFDYGQSLFDLKKLDEADAVYNQMLAEDETDEAAMVGLARNHIERGDYTKAIELMDRAEKLDADYSEIYRFRMRAYDKTGKTDKAINDALTWYDKDDDGSARFILPILLKHKSYAVAKAKARMKDSDQAASWHALLTAIYEGSGDYELAIKEYDFLEQEYGKDESIYLGRGNCYDELGMTDLALFEIDKAIEISDDGYNHSNKGDVLRRAARYNEAMKEYDKVIEELPDNAYGYYALGWCHELTGDDVKAMEFYDTGIDLDQSYPYIYLMRGELHLKNGDKDKATADFETVIAKDTTAESGSCAQYALHFLGRDKEAEEWMDKIIESDPFDAGHWYDKACLFARMDRADDSVKALEKALEMGYCSFGHIRHDDDMDSVRDRDDFKHLISKYESLLSERISRMELEDSPAGNEETITEVSISRHSGGTFDIACQVNGLPLSMIFDTGASDVSISKVEADFMFKNNYISKDDIKGKRYYQTADGGISEGTVITLKEVRIGDAVLRNVEASVSKSQKAPLLLGESVLQKFGTFTVDNINSKLIIKH